MGTRRSRYVLCVKNESYEVSLERRKVYRLLRDAKAESHGLLRVIDDSGEDYLYPADFFVAIDVPKEAAPAFVTASL
jgi:hypothetical protein